MKILNNSGHSTALELLQLHLVLCVHIHLGFHFTSQSSIFCCKCLLFYCGLFLKQSQDSQISPGLCPHHHLFIQSSWHLTSAFIFCVCLTPSLHFLVCLKTPRNSDSSTTVTVLNFVWLNAADEPRLKGMFYVFLCVSLTAPKHWQLCANSISTFFTTGPPLDEHHCMAYWYPPKRLRAQSRWRKERKSGGWFCSGCKEISPSPIAI